MKTLGWDVLEWMRTALVVPDGEGAGEPFTATDEQAMFVLRFYEVDDDGRRKVRRAQLTWPKGMGKSPIAGAVALAEAKGPTRFDGWYQNGQPRGKEPVSPWVQIAGVSQDAAINTWAAVRSMIDPDIGSRFPDMYPDTDDGIQRIYFGRSGRIQPVTASSGTRRGQRVTFAVFDESSLWTRTNGGVRLAETIRDNLSKMGGSSLETTNAFVPGQGSVAEKTWEARNAPGVLCDWRHSDVQVESLRHTRKLRRRLEQLYGHSSWIDLDRLVEDAQDPDVDPANWRRMFGNEIVAESDAWVSPDEWAALETSDRIGDGEMVVAGFDGSRYDDATALVLMRVRLPIVQPAGVWEKPHGADGWEVPYDLVDDAVDEIHERFDVRRMYCDPPQWQDRIAAWAAKYPSVMEWPTYRSRPMADAVDKAETLIRSGELSHVGDETLTRHVLSARFDENRFGKRLRKDYPKSPDKIDAAVAMVLAVEARGDVVAAGELRKKYRVAAF